MSDKPDNYHCRPDSAPTPAMPTPLTDAVSAILWPTQSGELVRLDEPAVPADFARSLERELAKSQREAEQLDEDRGCLAEALGLANTRLAKLEQELEVAKDTIAINRKIRAYVSFVLTGNEESDVQLAADHTMRDLAAMQSALAEAKRESNGLRSDLQRIAEGCGVGHPDREESIKRIIAQSARLRELEADKGRLIDALEPFAKFACTEPHVGEPVCHNCVARQAIDAARNQGGLPQ